MNIAKKLQQILFCKTQIKNALESKGIDMTNVPFDQYANKILLLGEIESNNSYYK